MERLSNRAIDIVNELHTERLDYQSEYLPIIDALNQLAAFEETGLTPEEIKASRHISAIVTAVAIQDAALYDDSALARADQLIERLERDLKRYRESEEDGRLLVLPCRVGDMLWPICFDTVLGAWVVDDKPERVNEVGTKGFFVSATYGDPEAIDEFHLYEEIGDVYFWSHEEAVNAAAAKERPEEVRDDA